MSNSRTLIIPYSRHFREWLDQQQLSLGLTTYQTNSLCLVGLQPDDQIHTAVWEFDCPMALHATSDRLYLATRYQIWRLENVLENGQLMQDKYDRLYVPRVAYATGDLNIHAIAIDADDDLIFANTEYSCLATLHAQHSFRPLWKPQFISKLAPEDRCHLNGLATVNGIPRYVTAISQSDVASGWRHQRRDGGIVIDIKTDQIIARGLSMPHSPRWHENKLWLLNSGTGELGYIDNHKFMPVTFCPGYGRGLAFVGNYAIVGLSNRDYEFSGLLLEEKLQQKQAVPRCGIVIIDITSGDIIEWLDMDTEVSELYDVAILPQVRCPMAIGFKTGNISQLITIGGSLKSTPAQTSSNSDNSDNSEPETLLFRGINWKNSQLILAIALSSHLTKKPVIDSSLALFSCQSSPDKNTTYQQDFDKGQTLKKQGEFDAAEFYFRKAIQANPNYIPAHNNLGTLLQQQQRYNEAITCYQNTLQLNPNLPETLTNLASIYLLQDQLQPAETGLKRALEINPKFVPALYNLGLLYKQQAKLEAAIKLFQAAASNQLDYTEAYFQLAQIWEFQSQFTLAKLAYQRVQQLNPNYPGISHHIEYVNVHLCDWENYYEFVDSLIQSIQVYVNQPNVGCVLSPFPLIVMPVSPELSQKVAQKQAACVSQAISLNPRQFNYQKPDKLRLGYLSHDFYDHAVGRLIQDIFEQHNREEFEIFGYHLSNANDEITARIVKGCDEFRHLYSLSALESAKKINNDGIQVLIDLGGYTGYSKPEILAYKPAPIQAGFLGYPNTMGAEFVQYLITDNWVVPESLARFYTEEIVYLPHQFICSFMDISNQPLNRADFGLPESGFVFACFNRHYKISPDLFQVWMQILQQVEGSVLWLSLAVEETLNHLRRAASTAGVDPQRLIFARKLPHNQYLARMQLADLGLDTWNYSGGSTTIAALYGGLPVLTKPGVTNATRMGASICASAGVPEMICNSAMDYQEKALYWATHPHELQQLRQQIKGRDSPLFDVSQFLRNLETALRQIWTH